MVVWLDVFDISISNLIIVFYQIIFRPSNRWSDDLVIMVAVSNGSKSIGVEF